MLTVSRLPIVLLALASFVDARAIALTSTSGCQPAWVSTFGGDPGTSNYAHKLYVFDDGSGPALYVGGIFTSAGGVLANGIAKWNGSHWAPLGSGVTGAAGQADSMAMFDDGTGPALYVGGSFVSAGGVTVHGIAKWNGTTWSALGTGMSPNGPDYLTVFDDGTGPALYAAGDFLTAGGVSVSRVAKWDGTSWSALGSGMNANVQILTVFDDGSGPALYAGGSFTNAGGAPANHIAKWNGTSWSAVGAGANGTVNTMRAANFGGGPELYVGGSFTSVDGVPANRVAVWRGGNWSGLGSGLGNAAWSLDVYDDGTGPALYAAGFHTGKVSKWDGSNWSTVGGGMDAPVYFLTTFDDGSGPALFASGGFSMAGARPAHNVAKWNGSSWSPLGNGFDARVDATVVYDDGSGPSLFAAGEFVTTGTVAANHIAKWNGASWTALGSGMNGPAYDLVVFDDGGGSALYAGGLFAGAGGQFVSNLAKWRGGAWAPVGGGTNDWIAALTVFDDGSGPALYAGGNFTNAGGVAAGYVAKWSGAGWSALGAGLNGPVYDLVVFDDGSGPALYAGGLMSGGVFKWDGSSWSLVGSGTNAVVYALAVANTGTGNALYAGGNFTSAGGVPANHIARWDGMTWSALGSGADTAVGKLGAFDDGSGIGLYAGSGSFTLAGGGTTRGIARWDGSAWSPLGSGVTGGVNSIVEFDDGQGSALYVGGLVPCVIDSADSFLGKWSRGACSVGSGYCFGTTGCPCGNNGPSGAGCLNSLGVGGVLVAIGNASLSNDTVDLLGSGMPNSSALYFQGTAQTNAIFGDGLRCANGAIRRIAQRLNVSGASHYPAASEQSVSVRGAISAPGLRSYQAWYRNAALFCTSSTFNLTNGLSITWAP